MIYLVIGLNLAIALMGFYVAWRLWQVKRLLTAANVAISSWERQTQVALQAEGVPAQLADSQRSLALTRQRYRRLRQQLNQLQQIFSVTLAVLQLVRRGMRWRRQRTHTRS